MSFKSMLLGTRKGLLIYAWRRSKWTLVREAHSAIAVNYAFTDERSGTLWALLQHGHWGPKLQRSTDMGRSWEEVPTPAFGAKHIVKDDKPASVLFLWTMAAAHARQPKRLYVGTEPGGLFASDDGGQTFRLVEGLWNHPTREKQWFSGGGGTTQYPGIHSIWVDPRQSKRVLVGISCGGVFETVDGGSSWNPLNRGLKADYLPNPRAEVGHDPHLLVASPSNPDVLWQQNHCGVFRSTNGGKQWKEISEKDGPVKFGFAILAHPSKPDTAWVVPARKDECRVPVDRALCVGRTENGGRTWTALRKGLPQDGCYDIVYRHALDGDGETLAFGSTTGNLFFSSDGGEGWRVLSQHLPPIYSVRFSHMKA